ncbi:FliM/FliN family flagellar motor switch protein [Paraconexibacter antarcticus]|uniref:FliM/FliN family flagellar motor switch protein n=1 Tax=Paraconexibacter antarcticus TaxID=2949664 RepID=A0ABY5DTR9_9ACTN|nr:FliM/FliN family flagellar motor switch protein [Paraconexibacter antarcticus]UTI64678.1 FliM/FliN family flagellar motor switch protein [Paraconexibacter antarcticus]
MTNEQALLRLAASTLDAIRDVLETYAPGAVNPGAVAAVSPGTHPLAGAQTPAVLADVGYVDGVTGGNIMVIGVEGARRLAAAMMGGDPNEVEPGGELSELDFSAVGEAMNQMMSAAAMATSRVLGDEVEIAPPNVRLVTSSAEAEEGIEAGGLACTVEFTLCGAPCLLVQLVPHAFIVRMTRALDEMTESYESAPLSDALRSVPVRVWAEFGRAEMPSGRVVGLPAGALVELDREVDEPIDLYADGMRFAVGRLQVCEDGTLAIRVERILAGTVAGDDAAAADPTSPPLTSPEYKEVA